MDFIGGALPNVMFITGLIAIGLGLGIEFKLIEIKSSLSKQSRIASIATGGLLILTSIYLYTRPPQSATVPTSAAAAQPPVTQVVAAAPTIALPPVTQVNDAAPTVSQAPVTSASLPTVAPTPPPSAVPTATNVPGVPVPDIRGQDPKDAQKSLAAIGLQLGEQHTSCAEIGVGEADMRDVKQGKIRCQSLLPDSTAAPGAQIAYVLADKGKEDKQDD